MNTSIVIAVALVLIIAVLGYFWTSNAATARAQQLAISNDPRNQIGAGIGSVVSGVIGVIHV